MAEARPDLEIRRAGMEAFAEVHSLIREAAQWLSDRGEPLWGEQETSGAELARVAQAGELVIAWTGGEVCACMYLHNEDVQFWPEARPGQALYIHRLAVARRFAGRGFARDMLDWAMREAKRTGCDYLRLDCEPRPKLLALYRDAGFAPVDPDTIRVGVHLVRRHQKPVADIY